MRKVLVGLFLIAGVVMAENAMLPADEAFKFSSKIKNNTVVLNWQIAKNYYLYREKIKFSVDLPSKLGVAKFPTAEIKNDELFGKTGIYRRNLEVIIPILKDNDGTISLTTDYQGCVDPGDICHPSISKINTLKLTKKPTKSITDNVFGLLNKASNNAQSVFKNIIPFANDEEPLHPDVAFKFSAKPIDAATILVTWEIEDDYYLYHNKFAFEVKGADLGNFKLPKGKVKVDEYFGKTEVHKGKLSVLIPLKNIRTNNIKFTAKYQGCWEGGVCFPPSETVIKINLPNLSNTKSSAANLSNTKSGAANSVLPSWANLDNTSQISNTNQGVNSAKSEVVTPQNDLNETDKIASLLQQDTLWLVLLSFFGFGLLLSFTPCVFPMIPILSGIIIGQKVRPSTSRALMMSIVFVLAMSLTYASAGVAAGYFGQNLQVVLQTPTVLAAFAAVFVILAFSMFGYFEIRMPQFLQSKASELSNKQKSSLFGVLIMGFLSALIVGPCVAPPLAGALIYIGQTGDAVLGGLSLFVMSLGMGVPLILIGTGVNKLPQAGMWMDRVKHFFGVLMLAVAIYLLDRIIPPFTSLILWATLITFAPIALGALKPLNTASTPWQSMMKAAGMLIMAYGLLLWLLVARGGGDMFAPLSGFGLSSESEQVHVQFSRIKTNAELDQILLSAKQNQQIVMLDFYADWCITCKELERFVFSKPAVVDAMADVIALQIDVTKNSQDDKKLMTRFNIIGPPAILFFKDANEVRSKRIIGEIDADYFLNRLQSVKSLK